VSAPLRQLHLVTLGDPGRLTGGCLYQRRMVEAAAAHGFEVRTVALADGSPPRLLMAARGALRKAASSGASAVLLDSIVGAWCAPWLGLQRDTLPVVGIVHQPPGGLEGGRAARFALSRLDLAAYWKAALLLVTGEPVAEMLRSLGLPAGRLRVVPPGVDHSSVGRTALDLRGGKRAAILCVANWHPRKGLAAALEAVASLPPGSAKLHLVGDPEVDPSHTRELSDLLRQPRLATRVVVHGVLPPEHVRAMYAAADLFLLPSSEEPFGMVYTEALAAGLPVVGWRSGNLPRLLEDGVEGRLVSPGHVDALAFALLRLVEDEPLRRAMAERARRRAARLPSWEQSAEAFYSAVTEALAQSSGERASR